MKRNKLKNTLLALLYTMLIFSTLILLRSWSRRAHNQHQATSVERVVNENV